MKWEDWELLAGLAAAAPGGRNARFDPAGVDPKRRVSLAETLLDRDWIRAAHPLVGDGHLIEIRGVQLTQAGRDARAMLLSTSESGSPSSLDPDPETAWAALRDLAEPGSPLAEAIERERSELSGRGMVRSGMSRQRALQVAAEHDLGWDERSDGFIPAYLLPPQLDDSQRTLLDITAESFVEANEWPRVRAVIRRAVRDKGASGLDEAVWSLPKSVGHCDGQQIVLSSEGLAATSYGGTVLEALVAFARGAAEAYMSEAEEPTVSTTAIVRALNLDKDVLLRLNTLLRTEGFFLGSGHEDSDGWVYEVTSIAAEFRDCPSIEDYLRIRRRVMRPAPLVGQRPDAAHPPKGGAPPGRVGVSGLHEAVVEHAGELYANGHYSQAVFEALKALEVRVRQQSGIDGSGRELMDKAFKGASPPIELRHASGQSGKDEQEGFRFIFMGTMQGIRNPKGHDVIRQDDPARALEYLALASLLFRRLDDARADVTPDDGDEVRE